MTRVVRPKQNLLVSSKRQGLTQKSVVYSGQRTLVIPTLLAKVGLILDLRLSKLARFDLRPRPKISLARASFFLRSRSSPSDLSVGILLDKAVAQPLLTGLDNVVKRYSGFP